MRGDSGYAYLPAGQAEVEFGKYEERIRQLEQLNATLGAEIDRMQPVVTWALTWNNINYRDDEAEAAALEALSDACDYYESSKPK